MEMIVGEMERPFNSLKKNFLKKGLREEEKTHAYAGGRGRERGKESQADSPLWSPVWDSIP